MKDWLEDLSADERDQWDEFVVQAKANMIRKMTQSAIVLTTIPQKTDVKFAVELGFAIMMDKPIVAVVETGIVIPRKLRQVADAIIEVGDLSTIDGQEEFAHKLVPVLARLKLLEDPVEWTGVVEEHNHLTTDIKTDGSCPRCEVLS